ncbi:MAG TPA: alanine--tRNA ligase [Phycisphaerae bacterium]|nr:alanine--tRNA ligase [Phycisphaerae bacterium]
MTKSCQEIRREFIEFFEQRGHTFVPSSPLLPGDDPTLLFANAGMNQFKPIFLGQEKRPYVRAANSQKCIRAGGKHNDLEDVGRDTYHHTFFEMLGNWSFGDYFKKEAISWAWELLTKVWRLPADRLHVTVFEGDSSEGLAPDDEAAELWASETDIDPAHIHRGNKKDNFWEMGETGPCGPCSEIHIDLTDDRSGGKLVNAGDPRVMEIWNLVFMQFNRGPDGKLSPLPATHVDTGMGLERIGMVLQGKKSNYATDLFVPIIEKIETLTSHRYGAGKTDARFDACDGKNLRDVAFRAIADHARTLSFAIADGIVPSNEGRGYVLRRILRRAARYGRQELGIEGPFLCKLAPAVVAIMGDVFSELRQREKEIVRILREEEESFARTLDRGIDLFEKQASQLAKAGQKTLPGEVAFDLYATYGFPIDLTQLMAAERGITVDVEGFDHAMARHRELSGAGEAFKAATAVAGLPQTDDSQKYSTRRLDAKVLGWVVDGKFVTDGQLNAGEEAAIVLDRTCFYAEQGGQVGDAGHLEWSGPRGAGKFAVRDTAPAGGCVLHVGVVESGVLHHAQAVSAEVDASRLDTRRNHTATHLLNWALRTVLGDHVHQAGSVVAPDRLRFDFSHPQAVMPEQLAEVERLVNEKVLADEPVRTAEMPLAEAKKIPGVRAVFGEKYGERVRVLTVGEGGKASVEFCGGTHLDRTSQVGLFKIVSEESVARGVRRITAVTGRGAVEHVRKLEESLRAAALALKAPPEQVPERIAAMQKELKDLRKRPAGSPAAAAETGQTLDTPAGKVVLVRLPGSADAGAMRQLCDVQRQKGAVAVFVAGDEEGKVTLVAMVSDELVRAGKLKAGDWVKHAAAVVGGSGGGKPTLAQAGGKHPEKLPEAMQSAADFARKALA